MTRRYVSPIVDALKAERTRRGLSQRRLAGLSGLAQQTISELESGRRAATTVTLDRYIAGLGVTVSIVGRNIGECFKCAAANPADPCERHAECPDAMRSVQSSHEDERQGDVATPAANPTGQLDGVDGVGVGYASEFAYGVERARHPRPLMRREHQNGLGNSL